MPFELILNDDGFAEVKDGWPLCKNTDKPDDDPVPVNIARLHESLAKTRKEAQNRREAGEVTDGLIASAKEVLGNFEISQVTALMSELVDLRAAKEAGDLGEDAQEEIKTRAKRIAADEVRQLTEQLKVANVAKQKSDAERKAAHQNLEDVQVNQALTSYHSTCERFAEGTREGFALIASAGLEGYKWRWGKDGKPVLQNSDGSIRQDSTGLEPMGIDGFRKEIEKTHSYLFKAVNGLHPKGGATPPLDKDWSKMSQPEKDLAFAAQISA